MLHVPELGGMGQSVDCVAAVQRSEQNVRLLPMKQMLLAQSAFIVHGEPKGSPPSPPASPGGYMSLDSGGSAPPHPTSAKNDNVRTSVRM
jgi:hypothetical protein